MAKSEGLDEARLPMIRSIEQLRRWHREVEDALRRSIELEAPPPDADWAAPPWAGTMTVRPLASRADLEEEGRFMTHCVAMYAAQVARGDYAVYRVLEPVRATLGLERRGDSWVFQQVQGVAGATLPQEWVAEIVRRVNRCTR